MTPRYLIACLVIILDSRRWRTHIDLTTFYEERNTFRNPNRHKYEVTLGVNFNCESEILKIEKAVSSVVGVESVSTHKETRRLIVCGRFDIQAVVRCVREFEMMVQVLLIENEISLLHKKKKIDLE